MAELADNQIKDSLGRIITLREISGRLRLSFYRALGAKDCTNFGVVNEYWNCMAVAQIGDTPTVLKSLVDLDFIYDQLDKADDAFELIAQWLANKEQEKEASKKELADKKK